jgi:hypothetical protein
MGYVRNIRGGLGPEEWPSVLDHALGLIVRRAELLSAGIRVARPFINDGATWFVSGGCLTGTEFEREICKGIVPSFDGVVLKMAVGAVQKTGRYLERVLERAKGSLWPRQEARKLFIVAEHWKCYLWEVLNLAKKRIGLGDRTLLQGEEQLADEEFQPAQYACDVHDAKQRTRLEIGTLSAAKDHNDEDFISWIGSSGSGSSCNDLWRRRGCPMYRAVSIGQRVWRGLE